MEIINLPLVNVASNSHFFSDDVDKPSRFFGLFFELDLDSNNLAIALQTNDESRTESSGSAVNNSAIWSFTISRSPGELQKASNPMVIKFDFPIFSSNGTTIAFTKGQADHVMPNSVNIFVQR
tara:strand:- start:167 stop:535 length:369 start_codon:yes stop_codon:yes gene_type:complete